jgi:hypothetical protein
VCPADAPRAKLVMSSALRAEFLAAVERPDWVVAAQWMASQVRGCESLCFTN